MQSTNNIATVVVMFHPEEKVIDFYRGYTNSGNVVIAIVNEATSQDRGILVKMGFAKVVYNSENIGLASALNQGLKAAQEYGAQYVLLLDQDSKPHINMGNQLVELLDAANKQSSNYAAIGPLLFDNKRPLASLYSAKTQVKLRNNLIVETSTIATSGTVIDLNTIGHVGYMLEELFIDGIDHEWCHRVQSLGYKVGIASNISMSHDMGDGAVVVCGRYRPLHRSPLRHYYIVRNTLLLARLPHTPLMWGIREKLKLCYRIPVYVAQSNNVKATISQIWNAIRDANAKS